MAESPTQVTSLPNGLRVVTEAMPEARSVTLGVWVGVGARDESAELHGASHFLEHLLFKGTPRRSARELAQAVDAVGGEMNAFTAKEHTAYYARLPADQLSFGLSLLGDVITDPRLDPSDVDAERQVILEELLLSEDEPEERVEVLCHEALFPDHPLGREVLGSHDSISGLRRDDIDQFFRRWYSPADLVLAAAGDLEHDAVVDAAATWFPDGPAGSRPERHAVDRAPTHLAVLTRPTEQAHLALGWRAVAADHPDRYALTVLNHVFGGGMSSRLFQEIRERRGLAYSVGSYAARYSDAGCLVAYAGTAPARLPEVRALMDAEVERLATDGITAHELEVATGYITGSLQLSLEDSASRMVRLGSDILQHDRVIPLAEHLDAVRSVTLDDVARMAATVFGGTEAIAAVGPVRDDAFA
ncbi:MAG TPA: pitrilysin family protein [Acidimicrobiales bacterium]|nr:pitrilysin family protein [Acidimicrobiales bacterium]